MSQQPTDMQGIIRSVLMLCCRVEVRVFARNAAKASLPGVTTAACVGVVCCAWIITAPGSTTASAMPTTRPFFCSYFVRSSARAAWACAEAQAAS